MRATMHVHACMHYTRVYIDASVCIRICMHARMHVCLYCMPVCVYVCVYVHLFVCSCTCAHGARVYALMGLAHVYACMHAYVHNPYIRVVMYMHIPMYIDIEIFV